MGRWGHPAALGQRAMGHIMGSRDHPTAPLPPTYLQEGGVGGIQLGVALHLWARGMTLAPWGAPSYCPWPLAPQLAHASPAGGDGALGEP